MKKQTTTYLMRHLAARDNALVGDSVVVVGASEGTTFIVGNGVHPDEEAHLQASEYLKAEAIGGKLYLPKNIGSVLIFPSPQPRADETIRHMFIGIAEKYAKDVLGLEDISNSDAQQILSEKGLHKLTTHKICYGLDEIKYKNSSGEYDQGDELVAQANCKEVNPNFPGYKWMVQKGFENDPRSEHPETVADRALSELVEEIIRYDLILSASHQPNMEIITAMLTGNLGVDANDVWKRAGGAYAMGGGFRLTTTYNSETGLFESAELIRTSENKGTNFEKNINVSLNALNKYLK